MGKINSRSKGQRGERAVIDLLQPHLDQIINSKRQLEHKIVLQRNTLQSDSGGFDIVGLDWLAIEVKNQESDQVDKWWQQCWSQARADQVAVLFYKRNHVKFRVRMIGSAGPRLGDIECCVDISVDAFVKWFRKILEMMED